VLTAGNADRPVGTYPGFAYVLPGQTRRLVLKAEIERLPCPAARCI